ncbi:MAG: hypothetical protein HDQ95_16235 [Roseburia sp.]|nr:hypothetical protein [Roseburia sp.]
MIYELRKSTCEVRYKDRKEIKEGCTLNVTDQDPEIIKPFPDKDEAINALKGYETVIWELSGSAGRYYSVTEYYVEGNEYDEDGEWIGGGEVYAMSDMEAAKKKVSSLSEEGNGKVGLYKVVKAVWGADHPVNLYFRTKEEADTFYGNTNYVDKPVKVSMSEKEASDALDITSEELKEMGYPTAMPEKKVEEQTAENDFPRPKRRGR